MPAEDTPNEGLPESQSETAASPPTAPPDPPSTLERYPSPADGYEVPPPTPGVPPLPQGVTLATAGRRIGAYFLSILLAIVTLLIGYVIWGLILWRRGTTPALSVLKMRCIKVDSGANATFGTMALREIVGRIAEGILSWITELVSLILFLARDDRRCLHDLIGGTVVVYDPDGRLDASR